MKKELKNIVVPIDFKAPSSKALQYAYNLSRQLGSELLLIHVIQTQGIFGDFLSKGDRLVQITAEVKDRMQKMVTELTKGSDTVKIRSKVELGKPYEKILRAAEEVNARMIILGENHQGDDARQDLGSTVYHVTLNSPVPVLTYKGETGNLNKSIVVPLDLTGQMRRQLFSAMVYAMNYNAKIHLVSTLIGGIKMNESRIYKKLNKAKKTLSENGVNCTTKLFQRSDEPPYLNVLQYAEEIKAGMILLMTHKEGYTYDNYIGAFAHHIINKSKVPVLSLTSSASDIDFGKYLHSFVDPAGMLVT